MVPDVTTHNPASPNMSSQNYSNNPIYGVDTQRKLSKNIFRTTTSKFDAIPLSIYKHGVTTTNPHINQRKNMM